MGPQEHVCRDIYIYICVCIYLSVKFMVYNKRIMEVELSCPRNWN